MICSNCFTTESTRWRKSLCSSCYNKKWREDNAAHVKKYHQTDEVRFSHTINKAKSREIEWKLSLDEYKSVCNKECYYCSNQIGGKVIYASGLDRINNNLGYQIDNVVPCCHACNLIKNETLSSKEMIEVAKLLISLRKTGG